MNKIVKFLIAIIVCQLAGVIGSIFNIISLENWYPLLVKPSFNPPNWVFAPVWTSLFFLMGISLYLIWTSKKKNKKIAINLFIVQLILNILWSALFFGLRCPLCAFIEIIVLWIAILFTIIYFYKISKISAYLLIPYIIWVSFAAVLNMFIFLLN